MKHVLAESAKTFGILLFVAILAVGVGYMVQWFMTAM